MHAALKTFHGVPGWLWVFWLRLLGLRDSQGAAPSTSQTKCSDQAESIESNTAEVHRKSPPPPRSERPGSARDWEQVNGTLWNATSRTCLSRERKGVTGEREGKRERKRCFEMPACRASNKLQHTQFRFIYVVDSEQLANLQQSWIIGSESLQVGAAVNRHNKLRWNLDKI